MGLKDFNIPKLKEFSQVLKDKSALRKEVKSTTTYDVNTVRYTSKDNGAVESELKRKFTKPEMNEQKFKFDNFYQFRTPSQIRLESGVEGMHPLIYRDLMDIGENIRYSGTNRFSNVKNTIEFVRGGVGGLQNRIKTDITRLNLFQHSTDAGKLHLGKQSVLQLLNPREETRLINPFFAQIGASRIIKLPRFLNVSTLTNLFAGTKQTPGMYEVMEGYDRFGQNSLTQKDYRGKDNKLVQWANESFRGSSVEEQKKQSGWDKLNDALGDPVGQVKKEILNTVGGVLGIKLTQPDPPIRYIDSDKSLGNKDKLTQYKSRLSKVDDKKLKPVSTDYQDRIDSKSYEKGDEKWQSSIKSKKEKLQGKKIIDDMGQQGSTLKTITETEKSVYTKRQKYNDKIVRDTLGDKVNLFPYGDPSMNGNAEEELPQDLVNLRFKDLVSNKYIVFRAIMTGISDSLAPEWSGQRFIGRAENVYTYTGNNRLVNFSFTIHPKSEQELPILLEKLNALIGLTYPEYESVSQRMIGPFVELTIGDMYKEFPGFFENFSYQIEDTGLWETAPGMQFPKYITVSCGFRYVGKVLGNKYGKHIGIDNDKIWNTNSNPTTPITAESTPRTQEYAELVDLNSNGVMKDNSPRFITINSQVESETINA